MISTVTEAAFVERRTADWNDLDELTRLVAYQSIRALTDKQVTSLSPLYLNACADLSRARASRYSAPLIEYLEALTASAHSVVYGAYARDGETGPRSRRLERAITAFPRAVRARWRSVLLAALLFFVPFAFGVVMTLRHPDFALRLVPGATLEELAKVYAQGFASGRDVGESTGMAGFYVNNNVGIALRCFALGVFGGLGSVFFLVDNGLATGAILGYVASQGAGDNILTFVVGHSSLELGAIVLSGAAGMSLGWSVVAPGDRTRLEALQATAQDVVIIVFGAAVMLLMAAAIEAYWSSSAASAEVKRAWGGTMLIAVLLYMTLVGRGSGPHMAPREAPWT
jgi:uncharacterized membrane protein SpoIIM required for sporulation